MFLNKLKPLKLRQTFSKMSVFVQKKNPITGTSDWVVQNEDYDYHQEVARSAFADMLHDTERNQLYEQALKAAISKKHSLGEKANVLDIGTGTGLLSMMAVRNGADSVIACEAFKPMSECALNIIKLNGFEGKIKIIPKRSTDVIVGDTGDMPERCNILVTEVFDTELIGEGALSTFQHAHDYLLEKNSIVVPDNATIFAQVVECSLVQNWNKLDNIHSSNGKLLLTVPESVRKCPGSAAVHDIQLSELPNDSFKTIISPVPVLKFDWSGKTRLNFERTVSNTSIAERDGKAQAVFMWWELQMDTESKIILSCAPIWAHPWRKCKGDVEIPWRDHWMQAVYYLPNEMDVKKGQEVHLISSHDEYSLWFNLSPAKSIGDADRTSPVCDCGLHVNFSRTRIGQMNDLRRIEKYLSLFEETLNKDSCVLVLGDGFYVAAAAAKLGVKKMYFLETNTLSRFILLEYIKHNNITNIEIVPDLSKLKEIDWKDINCVIGEPYFTSSIIPWDNLLYFYLLKGIKKFVSNDIQIFPRKVVVRAVAMHFKDLYKIRSPLGNCEGFLMKNFDKLIENSRTFCDDSVEAQPLWEYPGFALSEIHDLSEIDFVNSTGNSIEKKGTFTIQSNLNCNGVALWTDWYLTDSNRLTITTGPVSPIKIGQKIDWDMYTRQGVYLFAEKSSSNEINYSFNLDLDKGNVITMSVAVFEKPLTRISLPDWYANNWNNQQTNERRRCDAFDLRHESRQMRNETAVRSDWDTYHNNVRLADRITELDRWRDTLKSCLDYVKNEIKFLRHEKFETEREIDALHIPIIAECISLRDGRHGKELTYDEGDAELKRELCLAEHVKCILKERCQNTWEKLNRLEEVKFRLTFDLDDKTEAYDIDKCQLKKDKTYASITFKIDPLRIPKGSLPYEGWLAHSRNTKQMADNELSDTLKFREALFVSRTRAQNDMLAQREYVDFIVRKRVYETQKARNEMEWQSKKIKEEMEKLQMELKTLREFLKTNADALKLAESRLECRSYRPGAELCRDDADKGLKEEVLELRKTRKLAQDKVNCCKTTYNALEDQQVIIDRDVADKDHALMTDLRVLDLRARMRGGEPATQTDRNIELTNMEKEIART
ncbi:unnamed protein product [Phyllotreta striolata]|uniref:Protein arginine N-methyltransferase 7 n=1 Tax=Phyllotreta striolata TaxID=444603 RepID=A0A9N9XKP2_PHYSR|nr:unnamed protein product [Phyllotreta striolata]